MPFNFIGLCEAIPGIAVITMSAPEKAGTVFSLKVIETAFIGVTAAFAAGVDATTLVWACAEPAKATMLRAAASKGSVRIEISMTVIDTTRLTTQPLKPARSMFEGQARLARIGNDGELMTEIDTLLARLHDMSVPGAILSLDGAALAAVGRSRVAQTRRSGASAAVAALILGVAGSALPAAAGEASGALPLGGVTAFAPSALLAN